MAPRLILYRANLQQIYQSLKGGGEPKNRKITPEVLEYFELKQGSLYNKGDTNRLCVLTDEQAGRVLQQEYDKHAVHGLPSFYRHISRHYLGITRKFVTAWLSSKPDFQLSRPLNKNRSTSRTSPGQSTSTGASTLPTSPRSTSGSPT